MSHTKLTFVLFIALALFGAGCNKKSDQTVLKPVADAGTHPADAGGPRSADAGPTIPKGWKVYRNEKDGYEIAYPPGWRVTENGGLYKDAPNLEQLLEESQGHFESITQVAPASIGVAVFNPEGKSVDQLWEDAGGLGGEIDRKMTIDGEYARLGICTGITYIECISALHRGRAYSIGMYDQGLVVGDPAIRAEIEQIINTFNFLP